MTTERVTIHPTAHVSPKATIGEGTRIWHEAQVREGARIGDACIIGKGAYIDFDVPIGNNVKIQNRASIYHGTTIEDGVFIGPHVVFTNDMQPRAINADGSPKSEADWTVGETAVRYGASIGAGSVILPGIEIGRFALVGAGAVVTRDVPAHAITVGNPAQVVGHACACGAKLKVHGKSVTCQSCRKQYSVDESEEYGLSIIAEEK